MLTDQLDLNARIRQFYDASSSLWERVWGEHMHHGYYEPGQLGKNRRQAQIDLIDRLLTWCDVTQANRILDLGCGIGGSSLELATRLQAQVTGITLSPVQADRATERAKSQALADQVQFQVADALAMPFADNHFDFVWSLESGEHMADKRILLQECFRVLQPGGKVLLVTWCHRAGSLSEQDRRQLQKIYDVYCLPYVISLPEYVEIAAEVGFESLKSADWSAQVAPFWDRVIESAWDVRVIPQLVTSGWGTVRAALSLGLMSRGYQSGLICYGLLSAVKPL